MDRGHVYTCMYICSRFLLKTSPQIQQKTLSEHKKAGEESPCSWGCGFTLSSMLFFFPPLLSWHCLLSDFMLNQSRELIKTAAVEHRAVPQDIYIESQPELAIINLCIHGLGGSFCLVVGVFFLQKLLLPLLCSSLIIMNNMLLLEAP